MMGKSSLAFFITTASFILCVDSLQLICNTKNEICSLKSHFVDTDELPQVNFTFLMDAPENVTHIRFENSEIGEIPKVIFERFENLQVLDLKFCALKRFRKASLENAHNLIEIDLSYNKLKRLEEGLFSVCKKLVTLNLFRNDIVEVNEKAFSGLNYLEKLVLSSNEIRRLRVNVFRSVPALTELDLKKNRIEDLGVVFQNLTKLEILELSFNKIKQLNSSTFWGVNFLEILDLSNNRIEIIHFDVFQTNPHLKAVNLANNKLKSLDVMIVSSSFKILDVSGNSLTYLNVTSGLIFLHATNTSINAETNLLEDFTIDPKIVLNKLSLATNNISSLGFLSKCCQNLAWIDVSHNPLISEDDDGDQEFQPMSKTIMHLSAQNISYQHLNAIDSILDLVWHTPQLESLDISHNSFQGLDWTLLPKLRNLTNLTARNCSIFQIDGLVSTFPGLSSLYFGGNQINCDDLEPKLNGTNVECHN